MSVLVELLISLFQMKVQLVHLADDGGLLERVLMNDKHHAIHVLLYTERYPPTNEPTDKQTRPITIPSGRGNKITNLTSTVLPHFA